jgi:hypothetical protein
VIIQTPDQYTAEWWASRRGLPTASHASEIVTPTGKYSAQSRKYMYSLIADSMGHGDEPIEPTPWMLRGLELEPEARALYEFESGQKVKEVGFITNDEITAGCSPDGLMDYWNEADQGWEVVGWEVKCPKCSTHIGWLDAGTLPPYHAPQVHFSMAVMDIDRFVFMSYFPEMKPLIVDVYRDDYTRAVALAIEKFTADLAATKRKLGL